MNTRTEKDSMGEMQVPSDALYGASTQRAVLNFPVSNLRLPNAFIAALGLIKMAAAKTNQSLGLLPADKADVILRAAGEVAQGKLNQHFVLDIFQTGSGTSTNMNANEVIANRALEMLGAERGARDLLHPNDHVNMSQSSNDVIPTAMNVSANQCLEKLLLPALQRLHGALVGKSKEFSQVLKAGRTHLQDATPITLGQEFSGYAAQIEQGMQRLLRSQTSLCELALGGTAVGTGINTHPEFAKRAISELNALTGAKYREASNHFEAQGARDSIVELSGQLKTIACSLIKIANDIRWLAAGPRCNLAEIKLPEIQPGSSIMPAKVNPVICESVMMVASQVIGNDACITSAAQHSNFELNTMMPVMAYNIVQAIELLAAASNNFVDKGISGILADKERCMEYAEKTLSNCTSLAPKIGYDLAAKVAKEALRTNRTVREVATEMNVLPQAELEKVLDLMSMTKPGL